MTVHELAAFPILISSAVITVIAISEGGISSAIAPSPSLTERGGRGQANYRHQ
jgi:hypothetical protein